MNFTHKDWLECAPYSPGEVWMVPRPLLAFRIDSDQHFLFRFVDIRYKPGYGFIAPSLATTNGSFAFLKACLPAYYRTIAQDFFESMRNETTQKLQTLVQTGAITSTQGR